MSAYVKSYAGKLNRCIFWLKMNNYLKNLIIFRTTSALVRNMNLKVNPSTRKIRILKSKRKYYADEAADFHDEEIPKIGSNDMCLVVILTAIYYLKVFLKQCKYIEKEQKID